MERVGALVDHRDSSALPMLLGEVRWRYPLLHSVRRLSTARHSHCTDTLLGKVCGDDYNKTCPVSVGINCSSVCSDQTRGRKYDVIVYEYWKKLHRLGNLQRGESVDKFEIIYARNNGSAVDLIDRFITLYGLGVRIFFVCQTFDVERKLRVYITENNFTNKVFVASSNSISSEMNWEGNDPPSQFTEELLLKSLLDGCNYEKILIVLNQSELSFLPSIMLITSTNNKTVLDTIIIHPNKSLNKYFHEIDRQFLENNGSITVLVSLGPRLEEFLLLKGLKKMNKATFILHSHPYDLTNILTNPTAKRVASSLSVFTTIVMPSRPSRGRRFVHIDVDDHLHSSKMMHDETVGDFFQTLDEKRTNYGNNIHRNLSICNSEFKCKSINVSRFKIFRRMLLPSYIPDFQYCDKGSWFVESEYTLKNNDERLTYTKKTVPHYVLTQSFMTSMMDMANYSCSGTSIRLKTKDVLTGNLLIIRLPSTTKLFVLPHRQNETIFVSCVDSALKTETNLARCVASTKHDYQLDCQFIKSNSTVTSGRRLRRSYNVNSINQQLLWPRGNDFFQSQYYRKKYYGNLPLRRNFSPEFTPRIRLNNFIAAIPEVLNCIGSTVGCMFCFLFLFYVEIDIGIGACMGACGVAVGGSCSALLGSGNSNNFTLKIRLL